MNEKPAVVCDSDSRRTIEVWNLWYENGKFGQLEIYEALSSFDGKWSPHYQPYDEAGHATNVKLIGLFTINATRSFALGQEAGAGCVSFTRVYKRNP